MTVGNNKKPMGLRVVQRMLVFNFVFVLLLELLLVVLYEAEFVVPGSLADDASFQFASLTLMEVMTIAVVPVALKLFSLRSVKRHLAKGRGNSLLPWATFRMGLLCLPMWVNTFLYYQTMSAAFGYMAIILFLCLFFIVPTIDRCVVETGGNDSL